MNVYGLIGFPLQHSFSARYFTEKFRKEKIPNAQYRLFPLEQITGLPDLLRTTPGLRGLNVTIPHKSAVIPYLDKIDETAVPVGAVNVIKIGKETLQGYNTDITGFQRSLSPLLKPHHQKALILGTGGSARAVAYVLQQQGISCLHASRDPGDGEISYEQVDPSVLRERLLIVNTTPLGMHPHHYGCPDIPYRALGKRHLLYDLVYNPSKTLFLEKGEQAGATIKNGLEMLTIQAEESWKIWTSGRSK